MWYHAGEPTVCLRWVLIRDPQQQFDPQALLGTDLASTPAQIIGWFVLRWQLEVTFHEARAHLGVETQRQWSDRAIQRTTPALFGLFSLVTLVAHELLPDHALPVRQDLAVLPLGFGVMSLELGQPGQGHPGGDRIGMVIAEHPVAVLQHGPGRLLGLAALQVAGPVVLADGLQVFHGREDEVELARVITRELESVYASFDEGTGMLARWRLARAATKLHTVLLDVNELTEHADNAIKFLSDMFSARLYKLAASKVGVPDYKDLVTQKVQTAEELYRFMVDQFNQSRAFVLELMVVIILIIELVYFFRGKPI